MGLVTIARGGCRQTVSTRRVQPVKETRRPSEMGGWWVVMCNVNKGDRWASLWRARWVVEMVGGM